MIGLKVLRPNKRKTANARRELRNALLRVGRGAKRDYEKLTSTWENQPTFLISTHVAKTDKIAFVEVFPKPGDEATRIYTFVNKGTKPHDIWAGYYTGKSPAKNLVFPSGFTPKTKVRKLTSGTGGSSPPIVVTPYVHHPGNAAREFDKTMTAFWKRKFKREMELAIRRAVQQSGFRI